VRRPPLTGLTLDTGALLALDHPAKARELLARLADGRARGVGLCVPVGVVAQAWRSPRQIRLARLIKSPEVEVALLTLPVARSLGALCARTGHDDVIDVHVAWCARERGHAVVTSDPDDIAKVDPTLTLIEV
jgi:predicted nucleic acid-binding protein